MSIARAGAARSRSAPARARTGPSASAPATTAGALAVVERAARPARRPGSASAPGPAGRAPKPSHESQQPRQPQLRVVPAKLRRRRAGIVAVLGCAATFSIMLVLTFFQAKIAAEQMRLDAVNRQIRGEQTLHSQLVLAVAQMQTPDAIVASANRHGLVPPSTIAGYISPTPEAVAAVLTSGGPDAPGGSLVDSANARVGVTSPTIASASGQQGGSKP